MSSESFVIRLLPRGLFLCFLHIRVLLLLIKETFPISLLLWETETSQALETPPQLLFHQRTVLSVDPGLNLKNGALRINTFQKDLIGTNIGATLNI